jgi:hypothetical protein
MKKVKVTLPKMKRKFWYYSLIFIVIGIGELIFLTGCKKEENKPDCN